MKSWKKVTIRYNGVWLDSVYHGGVEEVLVVPCSGMSYTLLLENIHNIVEADITKGSYVLFSLEYDVNKIMRIRIKNDNDVEYLLTTSTNLVIFVTIKNSQSNILGPSIPQNSSMDHSVTRFNNISQFNNIPQFNRFPQFNSIPNLSTYPTVSFKQPRFDMSGCSSFPPPPHFNFTDYMTDWGASSMRFPEEFDGFQHSSDVGGDSCHPRMVFGGDEDRNDRVDDVDIRAKLKKEHAVDKSYSLVENIRRHNSLVENIRRHPISSMYGNQMNSFKLLPSYLYMLKYMNPGTITDVVADARTGKFKFAFYALGASITGFAYARPVIVVDGTRLKGKYRGILFVAATRDGNNQLFPLAFGIGSVECDESWTYFMKKLKEALGVRKDLLIVSIVHLSIYNAIKAEFPSTQHGLCCFHIQQHLAKYGPQVVSIFNGAAYSYRVEDHERYMSELEDVSPAAAKVLKDVFLVERWARAKSIVRRFENMNSNIVENMISRLLWAKRLPVCSIFEVARVIVHQLFDEQGKNANDSTRVITDAAYETLMAAIEDGSKMTVKNIKEWLFKVTTINQSKYLVDLKSRKCQCMKFQEDMIPCAHAAAAIRYVNHDQIAYVDDVYNISTLRKMWGGTVNPALDPSVWCVPESTKNKVCEPPDNPRQSKKKESVCQNDDPTARKCPMRQGINLNNPKTQ